VGKFRTLQQESVRGRQLHAHESEVWARKDHDQAAEEVLIVILSGHEELVLRDVYT
jgi:hypothetical protein